MFYPLLKPLLFSLDPEVSHLLTLKLLKLAHFFHLSKNIDAHSSPTHLMGLSFPNPIGLAAGLDKNGDYIDALADLGFGFIEIGTVTPRPQEGNPKPRLFRFPEQQAILNRMGFNNKGIDYVVKKLQRRSFQGVLGVNIGKNADTPIERAVDDYTFAFQRVAPYASYVTVNISSPNTAGLRDLQQDHYLIPLLQELKKQQAVFFAKQNKYIPLVVKVSPDLTCEQIKKTAAIFLQEKIDGVVATNTTVNHAGIATNQVGGLSGKPLTDRSTAVIKTLKEVLQNEIPIIGCGGIFSKQDADEKFSAGAQLVQLYSGLIYEGPGLIKKLLRSAGVNTDLMIPSPPRSGGESRHA
jgi:dihydroorotate dehydrogenase